MKRRILPLLLSALALFGCAVGFTACKDGENTENTQKDDESFEYTEIIADGNTEGYAIAGFNGEAKSQIIIPQSYKGKPVLKICDSAFYGMEEVKSVTVGDNVTEIGELAFADCTALEGAVLGKGLKVIGDYAFSQCTALESVNFPAGLEEIGECAFVSCAKLSKAEFSYGLKEIGDCAFGGCSSLKSFKMPDSVTSVGWGVIMFQTGGAGFGGEGALTNSLTELVISKSLTEIPDYAFSCCNISSARIGDRVERICYSSFYGCGLLESVIIPKSVKNIQSYAFYECTALKSVYYGGTASEWNAMTIGANGNDILTATKYFYSETKPTGYGNYWHYVGGVATKWE